MKHILPFIAAALLLAGCGSEQKPPQKVVEIIGIDQSLSVKEHKLPDVEFMRQIIVTHVDQGHEYTIGIAAIGQPSDKPILVAHFPAAPAVDNTAPPTKRKKQRETADKIRWDNIARLDEFLKVLQADIFSRPADAQLTDINGFLAKAATMLDESTYRDSDYIRRVVLISDCINDTEGDANDALKPHFEHSPSFTMFLVGCKQPAAFSALKTEQFQSIDGLLLFLQKSSSTL